MKGNAGCWILRKMNFQYAHLIRRSFEYRGSRQMNQIMQEVRGNLERKPDWIGEPVWEKLKEHWESVAYKEKSRINKRNRESMAGASLHTGGSIPHRVHWKRMKQEKGRDPSLTEFYFRTHRRKDNNWVGSYAKSAYEKFEQKKLEISSQIQSSVSGEDNGDSNSMPPDIDIWVEAVGGMKKGRIFGLGSISKTLVASSSQPANAEDIDMIRSQVQALNISLQRQEQEKQKMRKELNDARKKIKEFSKTQKQLDDLMKRLGFAAGSSSLPPSSPQHSHDDSSDNQVEEEDYSSFERNLDDYD